MSDSFIRWIPLDATFVPTEAGRRHAMEWLRHRAPRADEVSGEVSPEIRFVDCGENLERIVCDRCGASVDESWWQDAMSQAAETQFTKRDVVVPCCRIKTRLDDLRYEWPIGFARFVLEARNAAIELTDEDDARVAEILGAPVRRILAHY